MMAPALEEDVAAVRKLSAQCGRDPAAGRSLRGLLGRLRRQILGRHPLTRHGDRLFEEELRALLLDAFPAHSPRSLALWLARPRVLRELTSSLSPITARLDELLGLLTVRDKQGFAAALDFAGLSLADALVLGAPLLHHAARLDADELVLLLLERGAGPESRDGGGRTAMHAAAAGLSLRSVRLLVEWGVSRTTLSNNGDTPLAELASKVALDRSTAEDPRLPDIVRTLDPRHPTGAEGQSVFLATVLLLRLSWGPVAEWAVAELTGPHQDKWDYRSIEEAAVALALSQRLSLLLRLLRIMEPSLACSMLWRCVETAALRGRSDLASALVVHLAGSLSVGTAEPSTVPAVARAICRAVLSGPVDHLRGLLDAAGAVAAAACRCLVAVEEFEDCPLLSPIALCCLLNDPLRLRVMLSRQSIPLPVLFYPILTLPRTGAPK